MAGITEVKLDLINSLAYRFLITKPNTCSCTSSEGDVSILMKIGTAPYSMTTLV